MNAKLTFTLAVVLLLSACAREQRCPLNSRDGFCSSVAETHAAAVVAGSGIRENVLEYKTTGPDTSDAESEQPRKQFADQAPLPPIAPPGVPLSIGNLQGPLFVPAKPYRYWVAPWTDNNGVVHGGEMQYFVVPGHFLYGGLEAPGTSSGLMGPVTPEALGFKPVKQNPAADDLISPRQTFNPAK